MNRCTFLDANMPVLCSLWLSFILLPFALHPFYIYGEHPMVLGVSPLSPLSGYLSQGSLILSVDGQNIRSSYELIDKMAQADANLVHGIETIRKGYCVPNKLLEVRKSTKIPGGRLPCPEGLASFIGYADLNFSLSLDIVAEHHVGYANDNRCCLNPKKVVKMGKCGEGWGHSEFLSRNFTCSQVKIYKVMLKKIC
ncbi:hypothetical protein HPP92_007230 [Vanilla planifolia]|uniref:PDZ domain-containing protein n=1 Tax=Vanilla planifolia TaxID=51239 RepID=A0A835RC95_VANPL|nr:hypothetical protein HPP92_007230 [Vanilla planifolia]